MKYKNHIIITLVATLSLLLHVIIACGNETESSVELTQRGEEVSESGEATPSLTHKLYDKSWAVVIGINQYENKNWPTLDYAVADALAMESKLEELGFDEIISLTDSKATKRNIEQLLKDKLPYATNENDRVLVFFAGHGHTRELHGRKQGFLIPVDGDYQKNYSSTTISMEDIRNLSSKITAKHIYYVIDACYSGLGLKPPTTSKRDLELKSAMGSFHDGVEGYLNKLTSRIAVQIITAGGKDEQADEGESHGLFTEYFLKGLEGEADRNEDKILTATEIGVYIKKEVSVASDNEQTPTFGWIDGEGEFVFLLGNSYHSTPTDPALKKEIKELKRENEKLKIRNVMLERHITRLDRKLAKLEDVKPKKIPDIEDAENRELSPVIDAQRKIVAEISKKLKSSSKRIKLRRKPKTLSTGKIRKMFKAKGFRDMEWNPEGNFPNEYEERTINGDSVVVDYTSRLMWQQSGSKNGMLFDETEDYVKYQLNGSRYAGFQDWRLPTIEELASLMEPAKDGEPFIDAKFDQEQQWCWSSDRKRSGESWPLSLNTGVISFTDRNSKSHVRCVRSLK